MTDERQRLRDCGSVAMSLCVCGHGQVHHGHLAFDGRWIDERKCWVWVKQKRQPHGCNCPGWIPA